MGWISSSLTAAVLAGFITSLGQIIMVRELLSLFYGNELSTGLIFAAWLMWTAAGGAAGSRLADKLPPIPGLLAIPLAGLALLLPVGILLIRAARLLWGTGIGEILPPLKMLSIAIVATGPFCVLSGFLFAFCWSVRARTIKGPPQKNDAGIYLGEALGAAASGIVFYFAMLPFMSALAYAWTAVVIVLLGLIVFLGKKVPGRAWAAWAWFATAIATIAGILTLPEIESASRQWQWGRGVVAVRDTQYHNLVMVKDENLYTVFANGLWLFSAPDPQLSETAIHPVLLAHPNPETVLLAGGGVAGLAVEILKHPSVRRIDYVEPDLELIQMAKAHLPQQVVAAIDNPRVHVFYDDPAAFIRAATKSYDAILLNVGDPMNAEMNRFYTVEFFQEVRCHLANRNSAGGVFSFAVSGASDMVGPAQARFLRSIYATLKAAFPQVLLLPGDEARFLAGGKNASFTTDPDPWMTRLAKRRLNLQYVTDFYILDLLDPFRQDYFQAVLSEQPNTKERSQWINRDFRPTCYFHNIALWGTQINKGFKEIFMALSRIRQEWVWAGGAILAAGMIGLASSAPSRPGPWIGSAVFLTGGSAIAVQMTLLLGFQILAGCVYRQMALIISLFMAGLALGAALAGRFYGNGRGPIARMVLIQAALCIHALILTGVLTLLHQWPKGVSAAGLGAAFSFLSLGGGCLAGVHFTLALKSLSTEISTTPASIGGGLYALDLVGSAITAAVVALFLTPLFGPIAALWMVFFLLAANAVCLWIALIHRAG